METTFRKKRNERSVPLSKVGVVLLAVMLLSACGKKVDRSNTDTSPVQPQDPQVQYPIPPMQNGPGYPPPVYNPTPYPQQPIMPEPYYGPMPCLPPSNCNCFPLPKKSYSSKSSSKKSYPKKEKEHKHKSEKHKSEKPKKEKHSTPPKPSKPKKVKAPKPDFGGGFSQISCTIYAFGKRSFERLPDYDSDEMVAYRLGGFSLPNFSIKETDGEKGFPGIPANYRNLRDNYGISCEGFLTVVQGGEIEFKLKSDDGARFWIDSRIVVSKVDDGDDSEKEKMYLPAGTHPIRLDWYQKNDNIQLQLYWDRSGMDEKIIPPYSSNS